MASLRPSIRLSFEFFEILGADLENGFFSKVFKESK